MTQIPNNFFEVPAQFTIPFSNCEINKVFLLAVLADVKPGRMLLDGTVVPTKVVVQQVSFRGVNVWQDLHPNQIEAIEAQILDQLDQLEDESADPDDDSDCGYALDDPKHPTWRERMEDAADYHRQVAKDERAERFLADPALSDDNPETGA